MRISIIIPVVNEATLLEQAIASAWRTGADEVIVVDGGSSDGTAELASQSNCRLVNTPAGRASQQNAGAAIASGEVLLFLHVDTLLVENGCTQIRHHLADSPDRSIGVFKQRIENTGWIYRLIEGGNRLRVSWWNLAYGDQGIFVRRELFEQLGGFPDVPLMEDYMFSQAVRKTETYSILPGPLRVNARRWENYGPLRQTFRNWMIATRFRFGVSPENLANSYRRHDR